MDIHLPFPDASKEPETTTHRSSISTASTPSTPSSSSSGAPRRIADWDLYLQFVETDDSEDEDYQVLEIIENTRYISARGPLAKSRHFIEEVLNGYDDKRFQTYY
ncbi:hypothetical protein G7K_0051-t1 [Saitoella complicata NRRL Y-17804]|uniref:Uncharacterized protein n=1 Tax=Saitoella complicata (strain BCRC 22490 / CBS 7301 / JCM 7358 / NBRC 10748 / NRRL Y-17804) TaxID=698492 RepID=A0A0E9N8S6_SAICN|nr:hypothetical protein G7K_0051-t1 [Saitoella complicata NRRL Y-17804]